MSHNRTPGRLDGYQTPAFLLARNPESVAAAIRGVARGTHTGFTVTGMHTMRPHMFAARKQDAILNGVSGGMALLGLLLAAAGLFGVTSYVTGRRIREFGRRSRQPGWIRWWRFGMNS